MRRSGTTDEMTKSEALSGMDRAFVICRSWISGTNCPNCVIASRKAAHPRVASLAPSGQFTFWQSPATELQICTAYQEIPTGLSPLGMTF